MNRAIPPPTHRSIRIRPLRALIVPSRPDESLSLPRFVGRAAPIRSPALYFRFAISCKVYVARNAATRFRFLLRFFFSPLTRIDTSRASRCGFVKTDPSLSRQHRFKTLLSREREFRSPFGAEHSRAAFTAQFGAKFADNRINMSGRKQRARSRRFSSPNDDRRTDSTRGCAGVQ